MSPAEAHRYYEEHKKDAAIAERVAARFLRAFAVARVEQILEEVPAQLEAALAINKHPFENGKKLPKTKLNARIDQHIASMHKLLQEYQSLLMGVRKSVDALPEKERREAHQHMPAVESVPGPQHAAQIAKESKPVQLREKLQKAIPHWRKLEALLSGQRVLFAQTV